MNIDITGFTLTLADRIVRLCILIPIHRIEKVYVRDIAFPGIFADLVDIRLFRFFADDLSDSFCVSFKTSNLLVLSIKNKDFAVQFLMPKSLSASVNTPITFFLLS